MLHVHGTVASSYRPGQVSAGPVWDAIAASVLALPPDRRRSILHLGLAGGTAARVLRALAPEAHIVGVELDGRVVEEARRHFDLEALGLEVVVADALEVLRREERRFDAVIEDVFVGPSRAVRKPGWLPEPGLALARRLVAPGGLLVSVGIHEGPAVARALRALCPRTLVIGVEGYHNRVFVGGSRLPDPRELRRRIGASPIPPRSLARFRVRSLGPGGRSMIPRGGR